ncbi:MAG: tyrosine-type recombinase/integrase [Candidatus Bathyarchaeales archaeon]
MKSWEVFLKVRDWGSDYEGVNLFLRHYARKSRSLKTRENICLTLKSFCDFAGKSPDELVRLSPKEASKLLQDYVDGLAEKGFSVRYVNVSLAYLKTFFRVNGFKGNREVEVERHHQPSRYRKRSEYIPTADEIYAMALASGSLRNKALILCLYTSGLRNSSLRALLYRDIKDELEAGLEIIKVPVYPEMKKVDPGACKGNIPYYSFISREAVQTLRQYLEERKKIYGGIADNEPLFIAESKYIKADIRRQTPVMKKSLEAMVKKAAKKAGIKRWMYVYPHCLRKAFESALRNAGLDIKDQEFLMGHILPGSQDAYYDYSKVEELRKKYSQIIFFPQTTSTEQFRKRQILDMVRLLGFPEEKIKSVEEALAKYTTVDEAMEEIRKLSLESYKLKENSYSDPKKIVDEKELKRYLAKGWDVQAVLPSGKILIRKTA